MVYVEGIIIEEHNGSTASWICKTHNAPAACLPHASEPEEKHAISNHVILCTVVRLILHRMMEMCRSFVGVATECIDIVHVPVE